MTALVLAGGVGLAAVFIALLRLARGERLLPAPRPLPYPPGDQVVALDYGFCPECTARRLGLMHLDGSFTCSCGHRQPATTGDITVQTPAPVPTTGTGAGTTQGDHHHA